MEKIIWSDEWNLDIGGVDAQHKNLVNILNGISERSINTQNLIQELINYAGTHFADEEELMFRNNYPREAYLLHKLEHRQFTTTLLEISFKITEANGNEELSEKLITKFEDFCFKWFHIHFLGTDKKFGEFLKGGANVEPKQ